MKGPQHLAFKEPLTPRTCFHNISSGDQPSSLPRTVLVLALKVLGPGKPLSLMQTWTAGHPVTLKAANESTNCVRSGMPRSQQPELHPAITSSICSVQNKCSQMVNYGPGTYGSSLYVITSRNLPLVENLEIPSLGLHCFGSRPLGLDKN